MNDNLTISTLQLFKLFPDQESARLIGRKGYPYLGPDEGGGQ